MHKQPQLWTMKIKLKCSYAAGFYICDSIDDFQLGDNITDFRYVITS